MRAAGFNYDQATCSLCANGKPDARCGKWFVAVHGGKSGSSSTRNLDERFGFSLTLTARVTESLDRVGEAMVARNVPLAPLGQRQGFDAKVEQLRTLLHMNWAMTVLTGQTPPSANDNLATWATGTVYAFVEPAAWKGQDSEPGEVGADWFGEDPESESLGLKLEMRFDGARRMQPQTAAVGPFI